MEIYKKDLTTLRKRNNGITMISLVVTVIILLILAGISISMLTGDNRNYKKSTRSKRNNRKTANCGNSSTKSN